jgi:uncharacterized protein
VSARDAVPDADGRVAAVDWHQVDAELEAQGAAVIERLLTPAECGALAGLYPRDDACRINLTLRRAG